MKVLIFDDTKLHRQAATLTIKGHDLTVVGTYDEAQAALCPDTDSEKAKRILPDLLEKAGLARDFERSQDTSKEDNSTWWKAWEEAQELATEQPDYDVVLTDLLVPASDQAQGKGLPLVGKEMPLGSTIALLALTVGVKNVAVVTDMNHHDHPASAAFDCFNKCQYKLESINLACINNPPRIYIDEATGEIVDREFMDSEAGKDKYPASAATGWSPKGLFYGKNWGKVLDNLLSTS